MAGCSVWNKRGTIGGSLVLLDGAEMTHTVNTGSTEQYKIDLVIGGDGYAAWRASTAAARTDGERPWRRRLGW